jgi:SARP family transcriptional regulator, regulator of embCAB operon
MRYEILGPLRVTGEGGNRLSAAPKMEIVLATLIVRANYVVPVADLVTEVWRERAPRHAVTAVYVYVSQLRKLLAALEPAGGALIETRAPGYRLRTEFGQLDLQEFQQLTGEGRTALRAGNHARARACLEGALALWRGPALAQLRDGLVVDDFAGWLEGRRVECAELLAEANLGLGRHREVVSSLRMLICEHPLHEAFYRQLMLGLAQSGRRAEALVVYQEAQRILSTELGLKPGRRLAETRRQILTPDRASQVKVVS